MSRTIPVGEAIGAARMRGSAKEDVIAYLAAADVPAADRRRWYREWCAATLTKFRREDLARVAPPRKPREQQQLLLLDL